MHLRLGSTIGLVTACGTTPAPPAVERLIEAHWTLPPAAQTYLCAYRTIDHDMMIGEFSPIIPVGTHHTVLTMGDPTRPDGVEPCDVATSARTMLYGSGVGTNSFAMPPGVAVRIPAGKQLVLNLHLYNTSDVPIDGLSGTDVALVDRDAIDTEAEAVLTGRIDLDVPPGASTAVGRCTTRGRQTIFAAGGHMHLLGRHYTVTARPAAGEPRVLVDRDYTFDDQVIVPLEPYTLEAGDAVEVGCTYFNPTPTTVHFGERTQDEMCFSGLYWYPSRDSLFLCTS